jgi:hypothetical protein
MYRNFDILSSVECIAVRRIAKGNGGPGAKGGGTKEPLGVLAGGYVSGTIDLCIDEDIALTTPNDEKIANLS